LLVSLIGILAVYDITRSAVIPDEWHFVTNTTMIAVVALFAAAGRLTATELGLLRAHVPAGVRFGLAAAAVVAVALAVAVVTGIIDGSEPEVVGLTGNDVLWRALVEIPIATVVLEELAFRGVMFALLARIVDTRRAFVITAVLFGLWHVPGAADGWSAGALGGVVGTVLVTALAGVVFQMLRQRSRSLVAPALAHWATNSLTLTAVWVASR
jgi:membrane protease YdiL (CAAX protease family)